jgi:hypothetical protein
LWALSGPGNSYNLDGESGFYQEGVPVATLTGFRTQQASPRLGAEISGVDLTRPIDDVTAAALRQAFTDYNGPRAYRKVIAG